MSITVEPFITTATGRKFYALADYPDFCVDDIAKALSKICRYGGHCAYFYSVAEHSVLVSRIMEKWNLGDPMEGLMHDASEAYLSDIVGPFKQLLPDYAQLEKSIEGKLQRHFGLPRKTAGCKEADLIALMVEGRALLPERGESMIRGGIPAIFGEKADRWYSEHYGIVGHLPHGAELHFDLRYNELRTRQCTASRF